MRFYIEQHTYYCGIDLHARSLYVCILDQDGNKVIHQNIPAKTHALYQLIAPYRDKMVIGVECMFCWYWIADFCSDFGIKFVLGHALYMKAIHGGKAKSDRIDSYKIALLLRGGTFPMAYVYPEAMRSTRDLLRRRQHLARKSAELKSHVKNTRSQYNLPALNLSLRHAYARQDIREGFEDKATIKNVDLDLSLIDFYEHELKKIESYIEQNAQMHNHRDYVLLRSIKGVGRILALTILYEIGDIERFPSVQQFASYSRLVKCKAESAGKIYGTNGNKIGNRHLKWAFSEACVLFLRNNPEGQRFLQKLQRRMSKAKALSVLAHKLGRCVYFMLKRKEVFDEQRFLNL